MQSCVSLCECVMRNGFMFVLIGLHPLRRPELEEKRKVWTQKQASGDKGHGDSMEKYYTDYEVPLEEHCPNRIRAMGDCTVRDLKRLILDLQEIKNPDTDEAHLTEDDIRLFIGTKNQHELLDRAIKHKDGRQDDGKIRTPPLDGSQVDEPVHLRDLDLYIFQEHDPGESPCYFPVSSESQCLSRTLAAADRPPCPRRCG